MFTIYLLNTTKMSLVQVNLSLDKEVTKSVNSDSRLEPDQKTVVSYNPKEVSKSINSNSDSVNSDNSKVQSTVIVDTSWDEEVSVRSYNPEKYVLNNLILRKTPPKLSKNEKENFENRKD
jgi:hypothetical protein